MEKERLISLVLSAQRGEEQAFTELFEAFHDDLYYHIFKAVNDRELAEDLLQESYIEIFQTIGQLNEPTAFVTWSKQIAYHRCTGYFKKRRELLADEDEDGHSVFDAIEEDRAEFIPDEALDLAELKQTIHAMINDLPEEQRTAILMRYYDEISLKEIAEIQGVPENTVKSRLNYGRKSIKEAVESYEKKHGIKLRCVGVVPLLLWLFRETAKDKTVYAASAASAAVGGSATAGTTTAAAATATAATGAAGTAAVSGAAVAKTITVLGIKFALPKLIAGVVAVALAIGGIVGGVALKSRGGSGSGGRAVDLNDYVTITASQYDGYGSLTVSLDTEKLIKDNAKYLTDENLDTQYFGADTPELAANFVFAQYKPYTLQYENSEYLNNGDQVKFSWKTNEEGIKILNKILKVKLKYSDFTYKVEGLEALVECDPFENINIEYEGYSDSAYFDPSKAISTTVQGETVYFSVDSSKTSKIANGDMLHLTLSESPEYYAKEYGIIPSRTEADIIAEHIDYLPASNPQGVVDNITEESQQNVIAALHTQYKTYAGEMKYEYVGAICLYDDNSPNSNLYLIYHLDNGIYPGGWYSYVKLRIGRPKVTYVEQEDGTFLASTTIHDSIYGYSEDVLPSKFSIYYYSIGEDFTYDGSKYRGTKTLKKCLEYATEFTRMYDQYDHMVVTDSLKSYLEEY